MKSLPLGSRIVDDRIVIIEKEIEADRLIPSDLRSARLVQSVANTISPLRALCQFLMSKLRWSMIVLSTSSIRRRYPSRL